MLDPKSLLPEAKKMLPNVSDQELMAGIQEFAKAHPKFTNTLALAALAQAIQPEAAPQANTVQTPAQPPFSGLVGQLGAQH